MCNTSPSQPHVQSGAAMYRPFSPDLLRPNLVRPNLPLRKPTSSPVTLSAFSPPPLSPVTEPDSTPVRSPAGCIGDGPLHLPSKDTSLLLRPLQLAAYFCNYCGQQGNLRCQRCKKTPYCSVACQAQDWKAHRHMCKLVNPEPAKEKVNETAASAVTGHRASLPESTHGDAPSLKRVYLKDLLMTKVIKETEIQASVIEFCNPGKFFIFAQNPELQEALRVISTELQKTHSCPSVTTYAPCVGEICAVQFSCDLNWYRGLVQTLASDQKKAHVLYIDFGNEEEVPVDRIKPLSTNVQSFGPCAMECRIAGVVPAAGSWSGECCIAVRQLLAGKTLTVRLVETLENGRIHAVDVLLSMGKQLSTFLLENGYAKNESVNTTSAEQEMKAIMNASMANFQRLSDGKDDNTWAQPPESMTQAVGDSFSVVVTHFQSPDEIIVQKVENAGVIQDLQLKLREHCCQAPAPHNFRPAPGTVCCARFSEDKQWYRAKVLAYSSEERVCVGYLDFGNSEEVDLGHLQPISPSLLALPVQAMLCGLAGVQPVGESWPEDCLLALQRRVSNRILRIEIQGAHKGKGLVTLIDEASDPQANIAELLCSAGFAAAAPVTHSSDQQTEQQADQKTAAEPHVPTTAGEPLVWSCTELPSDGQTVALLASVVGNPGEFYCRINRPKDHQQLIELGAELKLHCEANVSPFVPKVGEPCCAMFPSDGVWYRAMVNGLSEDEASVHLVDCGYTIKVEINHLRPITPRLLTLPFQAVRCWLSGVEPVGSEWSSEALLWFQTLVGGEQLSARVLSVSEQGYGVELESRGQNVAAALISEHLAKAPEARETHATTDSAAKQQEEKKEGEHSQKQVPASNQTGASSKEMPSDGIATLPEAPSFPVDWKTVKLPVNETFQPYIVATISPSLFYLINPNQVDREKLKEMLVELAAYCSNSQASLCPIVQSTPAPGAACCAQFSADNNWYRAVVLEAGGNEMSVIYADYGNTEKVPLSRILPIPVHLLQLPFQITRCTLIGKEHFPAEWPEEAKQMFQSLLSHGVQATVQSFDGSANVLSLTLPAERGGGHIATIILDALQAQNKTNPSPSSTQKADQTQSCMANATVVPSCPQPKVIPETQKGVENTTASTSEATTPELTPCTAQQESSTPAVPGNEDPVEVIGQMEPSCKMNTKTEDPQSSACCCLSLKTKVDDLEQLMQLQLALIKHLVGQTK